MEWLPYLSPIVVAIIGSPLLIAWMRSRRHRRKRREQLITTWRAMIARHARVGTGAIKLTTGAADIVTDPDYFELRRHLAPELVARLEHEGIDPATGSQAITLDMGGPLIDERHDAVARAVDELERRWRLV